MSAGNPFEQGLDRVAANHVPLTPLTQLERVASTWPDKTAIIHGEGRTSYAPDPRTEDADGLGRFSALPSVPPDRKDH